MIIRSMTANFGGLQNRTLELQPGLNVVHGGNEFGKTTWCAFLRCMLYGVDTTQRARAGQKPDKLLYAPWDGSPMAGRMEVEYAGKGVTLVRETGSSGAVFRRFSASYIETALPVPGIDATTAGEALTGVSLPVFTRTAFIGNAGMGVSQTPELERRIAALVSSGQEDCSCIAATDRLRNWQRKLRYRNQGEIPNIEREMGDLQKKLRSMEAVEDRLIKVDDELDHYLEAIRKKQEERERQYRQRIKQTEHGLRKKRVELEKAELTAEWFHKEKESAYLRLQNGILRGEAPTEEARKKWKEQQDAAKLLEKKALRIRTVPYAASVLLLVFGILVFIFGMLVSEKLIKLLGVTAFASGLICVIQERTRRRYHRELKKMLQECQTESVEGLECVWLSYEKDYEAWKSAESSSKTWGFFAKQRKAELDKIYEETQSLLTQTGNAIPIINTDQDIQTLRDERSRLAAHLEMLGDPMAVRSQLTLLEEERQRKTETMEACNMAIEELTKADAELQAIFCPALSRKAAEFFRQLTGSKYSDLMFSNSLSAMVRQSGEISPREDVFLSRGTMDQVYLALRLALSEMLLSGTEPCPIILDDALINFDDSRMENAMELLMTLSEHRQIILFSCHDRERRYMERIKHKNGAVF